MNRRLLALGLAIVVAGIMALYIVVASHDDGSAQTRSAPPRNPEPERVGPRASATPSLPSTNLVRAGATAAARDSDDYTIGDVQVRDHRAGEHARLDVAPVIHAPRSRKIPSQLASDISQRVRAVIAECAASVPAEARAAKPRIEGQVTIAIKDHQATITGAVVQLRDVVGVAVEPVKQCVEQKSIGVATPSGDEPDLDGYGITLSLRLP